MYFQKMSQRRSPISRHSRTMRDPDMLEVSPGRMNSVLSTFRHPFTSIQQWQRYLTMCLNEPRYLQPNKVHLFDSQAQKITFKHEMLTEEQQLSDRPSEAALVSKTVLRPTQNITQKTGVDLLKESDAPTLKTSDSQTPIFPDTNRLVSANELDSSSGFRTPSQISRKKDAITSEPEFRPKSVRRQLPDFHTIERFQVSHKFNPSGEHQHPMLKDTILISGVLVSAKEDPNLTWMLETSLYFANSERRDWTAVRNFVQCQDLALALATDHPEFVSLSLPNYFCDQANSEHFHSELLRIYLQDCLSTPSLNLSLKLWRFLGWEGTQQEHLLLGQDETECDLLPLEEAEVLIKLDDETPRHNELHTGRPKFIELSPEIKPSHIHLRQRLETLVNRIQSTRNDYWAMVSYSQSYVQAALRLSTQKMISQQTEFEKRKKPSCNLTIYCSLILLHQLSHSFVVAESRIINLRSRIQRKEWFFEDRMVALAQRSQDALLRRISDIEDRLAQIVSEIVEDSSIVMKSILMHAT